MKWHITRILIALILAFQFQLVSWLIPQDYEPVYATQTTAEVTVTYTIIVEIGPVSNLMLYDLGLTTVTANWSAGANATYHMVRGSRIEYPSDIDEGELLYYGSDTTCNITGVPLDNITLYVSTWAFQADNSTHSSVVSAFIGAGRPGVVTGYSLEVDSMSELSSALTNTVSYFEMGVQVFLVLGMMAIALWRKDRESPETAMIFLLVCGLTTIYIGLSWFSISQGIGLVFTALGGYQLFEVVRIGLASGGPSKGLSQFKGWYGKVRDWF